MKKYVILLEQAAYGCDHTIACGKKFEFIKSNRENMEDVARDYLLNFYFNGLMDCDKENEIDFSLADSRDPYSENKLKRVFVVSNENGDILDFDLETFHNECEMVIENAKAEKARLADEAEFERLKEKLGK